MGIAYLAAVLEANGITVQPLDCIVEGYNTETDVGSGEIRFGLTWKQIEQRISEYSPDYVGVSCLMSKQAENAHKVCEIAKTTDPTITTLMGGTHVSALAHQVARDPNVDFAVVGDAETTIVDILEGRHEEGVVTCNKVDVADLPWPARHLFPVDKYIDINMPTSVYSPHARVHQIETTRGCPFRCVFCATTSFKGRYQMRPVGDVLNEIRHLKDMYGIQELDIIDSNMVINKERTIELLRGIQAIGISWANPGGIWVGGLDPELLDVMRASGCYQLSLAIESSTPRILEEVIDKPTRIDHVKPVVDYCRRIGIDLHAFFVVGFPEQSVEEIQADYSFAREMDFSSVSFNIISPLPGSRLYEEHVGNVEFSEIDLRKASIKHPQISQRRLEEMIHKYNKTYNRSLLWRDPRLFVRKYVCTVIRKPSFRFMARMFNRQ